MIFSRDPAETKFEPIKPSNYAVELAIMTFSGKVRVHVLRQVTPSWPILRLVSHNGHPISTCLLFSNTKSQLAVGFPWWNPWESIKNTPYIDMLIVFKYKKPVGSRISLVEPLGQWYGHTLYHWLFPINLRVYDDQRCSINKRRPYSLTASFLVLSMPN